MADRSNDRIVWIDCEMTGLDLQRDALVEIAVIVTEADLTEIDEGVSLVIRPQDMSLLESMVPVVHDMHTSSGLLEEIPHGIPLADAEQQVLAYITTRARSPTCATGRFQCVCGSRLFSPRYARPRRASALSTHRFVNHQRTLPPLVSAGVFRQPRKARQSPCTRRYSRVDRGVALLPRGCLRAPARTRHRFGAYHRRSTRGRPELLLAPP